MAISSSDHPRFLPAPGSGGSSREHYLITLSMDNPGGLHNLAAELDPVLEYHWPEVCEINYMIHRDRHTTVTVHGNPQGEQIALKREELQTMRERILDLNPVLSIQLLNTTPREIALQELERNGLPDPQRLERVNQQILEVFWINADADAPYPPGNATANH